MMMMRMTIHTTGLAVAVGANTFSSNSTIESLVTSASFGVYDGTSGYRTPWFEANCVTAVVAWLNRLLSLQKEGRAHCRPALI